MTASHVAAVRSFNRFYTRQIGLLNEHVAQSRFTLGEGRVLYEIGKGGHATASALAQALNLDPAYLSRVLQKFAGADLIMVTPSPADRRANAITLTEAGESSVRELDRLNDEAIEAVLAQVPAADRTPLLTAMSTIRTVLGDASVRGPVILRPHRIGELGWMIHRQGLLYNLQFGWNGEFEALIAGIYRDYEAGPATPPKALWVAEQSGGIAGSIFVQPSEGLPGSAQLRMLYVEPAARGQGIGATLVAQAVGFARGAGYDRMRLWTHTIQQAARRIYAAAGFTVVETMPEENFGKSLVGEIWEMRF
jgi:DNA-binding MarR family transcriptional regulator/GNAT superfamily N-acetyltransferase